MSTTENHAAADSRSPLWSTLSNDPDMAELIEYFVAELPMRAAAIASCTRQADLNNLAVLAHQIKGAAGGYGFESITDAARQVEQLARQNAELTALQHAVDELVALCTRARAGAPTT